LIYYIIKNKTALKIIFKYSSKDIIQGDVRYLFATLKCNERIEIIKSIKKFLIP
jgi:hypothetical protein